MFDSSVTVKGLSAACRLVGCLVYAQQAPTCPLHVHVAVVQVVQSTVQSLMLHGALEATLASAPGQLVASLLHHVRRQLSNPSYVGSALTLAECLFNSCPAALAGDDLVQERLNQLQAAVAEELQTQEKLMLLQGIARAILCP